MMGGGFGTMGVGILLLVVLVFGVIIFAGNGVVQIFQTDKTQKNNTGNDNALEQLKVRFAKGDITKEEYLKSKQILHS